ncbi:MAG: hypothetical protein ACE5I1_09775 [bacterium]
MNQHITILGILYIAFNIFFVGIAMLVFFVLTGAGVLSGDAEAMFITSTLGTVIGFFIAITSLPGIIAGYGILKRKEWGRILSLILGVLNLINIPFGTILGIYTLYVLLNQETIDIFSDARGRSVVTA